jgi:hypothetical protein
VFMGALITLSFMPKAPWTAHQMKDERKEIGLGNFTLGGSSHKTGNAAFTPATPNDIQHSRANTDSHNSHNTQHTRVKKFILLHAK